MLVSLLRVLHGLPGQLVPAQVIAFLVMGGGGPVRMRSKFVEFSGSLMGIARHGSILTPPALCSHVMRATEPPCVSMRSFTRRSPRMLRACHKINRTS